MSFIALILSGAALLINGLGLLGRIPARDAGYFNILIGTTQLVLAILVAASARDDATVLLGVSGVFLFGLTYLYVGLNSLLDLGSAGLGWFCGLVAAVGLVYAATSAPVDPLLSVLWVSWAALWTLFFLLLALGRSKLTAFTGWALVLTSQATTTIPALLGLTGTWPVGLPAAAFAAIVVVGLFATAAFLARVPAEAPALHDAALPAPALSAGR